MVRESIVVLITTKRSTRRDRSSKMLTQAKGMKDINDIDQGRKDSLEKRILTTSQMKKVPESLRYPESRKLISEDNVIQGRMKLSKKRIELVISDNIMNQSMIKDYIEIVDVDIDEEMLNMNMRLEYFGLRLHDQMKISEIDKLLKGIDQIEK